MSNCGSVEFPLHRSQEDRNVPLEPEQITAIIKMAHEMEKPSIALAQAFYSDCGELEQKDILGEWVPFDVTSENEKWICGIRWEEIDADFVLRHQTSREGKIIKINLEKTVLRVKRPNHRFRNQQTTIRLQHVSGILAQSCRGHRVGVVSSINKSPRRYYRGLPCLCRCDPVVMTSFTASRTIPSP